MLLQVWKVGERQRCPAHLSDGVGVRCHSVTLDAGGGHRTVDAQINSVVGVQGMIGVPIVPVGGEDDDEDQFHETSHHLLPRRALAAQ